MESAFVVVCCRQRRRVLPVAPQAASTPRPPHAQSEWLPPPPVALHRAFQFSWTQSLIALVVYALLLTDVMRTGLGVSQMRGLYWMIELELFVVAGPWEAAIGAVAAPGSARASDNRRPLWDYKFDTSSVGMRSLATFLQLSAWPQCVLQRGQQCPDPSDSLSETAAFGMLDALVDAVRQHSPATRRHIHASGAEAAVTLRVESKWRDRVHDYILPELFANTVKGTTQALYYNSLASVARGLCSRALSFRPYACGSLVASIRRLSSASEQADELMAAVIVDRVATLQASHPTAHVDFLLVETCNDASKGGLTFQGRRIVDAVLLTRVRNCAHAVDSSGKPSQCTTALIDEYRFDSVLGASNVAQWYPFVASLRVIGQAYMWLRLLALLLACHESTCADPMLSTETRLARFKLTLKAFAAVPSHIVAYSNVLSTTCYAVAHLIDSSTTYEILAQKFTTSNGVLHTNLLDFFLWSSVQMRNIWLLVLALHLRSLIFARRCWTPASGMRGIAEFVVSGSSMLTIFAQLRKLEFRDTSVLSVHEVPHSSRISSIKSIQYHSTNSASTLFSGSIIDFKCLCASAIVICAVATLADRLLGLSSARLHRKIGPYLKIWTNAWLPNSAEYLWPAHGLVVTWHDADTVRLHCSPSLVPVLPSAARRRPAMLIALSGGTGSAAVAAQTKRSTVAAAQDQLDPLVYLTNVVMLTDPITFVRLRCVPSGVRLCFFQSKSSPRTLLVPHALVQSEQDASIDWSDWRLLAVTDSTRVSWSELLRCGGGCG